MRHIKMLKELKGGIRPYDDKHLNECLDYAIHCCGVVEGLNVDEIVEDLSLTFIASGIRISNVRIRNLAKQFLKRITLNHPR